MDAPPPDKASMDPSVATDMQGEEEGASADHDVGADDGDEIDPLLYNVPKKKVPKRIEAPSPQKRTINITEYYEHKFDESYDSDGRKGPFWNATRLEGPQLSDDDDDIDDDNNQLREELVCDVIDTTGIAPTSNPKDYSLLTVEITKSTHRG